MAEYIEREKAIDSLLGWAEQLAETYGKNDEYVLCLQAAADGIEQIPAADVRPVPEGGIGEMSDGYHTFNGLYYQRMILFAALVKAYKDKAWKSHRHEDGELCFGGGWFIVGIDTPDGSYTYHYEDKDWDLFDCVELPVAKHWDGHNEKDVTRLLTLDVRPAVRGKWINDFCGKGRFSKRIVQCSLCGNFLDLDGVNAGRGDANYCPNCGADMREES